MFPNQTTMPTNQPFGLLCNLLRFLNLNLSLFLFPFLVPLFLFPFLVGVGGARVVLGTTHPLSLNDLVGD